MKAMMIYISAAMNEWHETRARMSDIFICDTLIFVL